MHFDRELDARGLNCPLPILRTKKSLNDMSSGQVIKVLATDPGLGARLSGFLAPDRPRSAGVRRGERRVRLLSQKEMSRPPRLAVRGLPLPDA